MLNMTRAYPTGLLPHGTACCSLLSLRCAHASHESHETEDDDDRENGKDRQHPEIRQDCREGAVRQDLTRVAWVRVMDHATGRVQAGDVPQRKRYRNGGHAEAEEDRAWATHVDELSSPDCAEARSPNPRSAPVEHRRKDEEQQPGDDQPADHVVPGCSSTRRQGTVSMRLPWPIHARPEELRRWDLPPGKASNLLSSCHGTSLTFQLLDVHGCVVFRSGEDLACQRERASQNRLWTCRAIASAWSRGCTINRAPSGRQRRAPRVTKASRSSASTRASQVIHAAHTSLARTSLAERTADVNRGPS
jgi:hypothetical protein